MKTEAIHLFDSSIYNNELVCYNNYNRNLLNVILLLFRSLKKMALAGGGESFIPTSLVRFTETDPTWIASCLLYDWYM